MVRVSEHLVTTETRLAEMCEQLASAEAIAFDTEFVAEHTYKPVLCLVQVAAGEFRAVIDALAIRDLKPFWQLLARPGHVTIVHAGREEVNFCLESVGQPPAGLWDVQLAAALVGCEYPAGYGNLVRDLCGEAPHKRETRTDWRRRPLSARQIEYALDDVEHLEPIRQRQSARLEAKGRADWFKAEMDEWLSDIIAAREGQRWRRVAGSSGLSRRELAIVEALWHWRDAEARRRNRPSRTVLRDDLIVELARRRSADVKQIQAVRGLERHDLQKQVRSLAAAISRALELPREQCPETITRDTKPQLTLVGQFLQTALSSICRAAEVAPALVATADDVRELVAYRLDGNNSQRQPPRLTQGWRAEVVGRTLDDLLTGKLAVRIDDAGSPKPLAIVPLGDQEAHGA